jgi:hypothetical protein
MIEQERNVLIEQTIQETLAKTKCKIKGISYFWTKEKRRLACALGYRKLFFSKIWWGWLTEEQRKEVVIHEVCHLVDVYFYIKDESWKSTLGHGYHWRELMKRAGAKYIEETWTQDIPEQLKKIIRNADAN